MPSTIKSDAQWAAESDARTLAEADLILVDDKRLTAARKAAKAMVDAEIKDAKNVAKRLDSLLKIAGRDKVKVEGIKVIPKT